MPIHNGIDKKGHYYQWGNQKKYYYTIKNRKSREEAYKKAKKQGIAIRISEKIR